MNDSELLERFARDSSQEAFRELVARHTNLVYACAVQRLRDTHAAQDVTQAVFVALALKAKSLGSGTPLAGWLYQATKFACAKHQRAEERRKEREMRAHEERAEPSAEEVEAIEKALPHLAQALDSLSGSDRETVLLRFYRNASHQEVATSLGISEEAAKKRGNRALEKLHRFFVGRGVVLSTGTVAAVLTASATQATPAGLAAAVGEAALAGVGGTLGMAGTMMLAKGALKMMFLAKLKSAVLVTTGCLAVAGTGVVVAKQLSENATALSAKPDNVTRTTGPVVTEPVFVPRTGRIATSVPLPRSAPWVTKLLWARDGKHIVVVIDPTIKVNNGSISKEGPDENNVLAVDLGTKETRQLFTTAGTPMSMAGNRLLVPMAGKLLLIEDLGLGARKELPGKEWYLPRVSQDGKYVAYFTGDMGQSYDTATIRLATAEGEVSDLAFPAEGAPGPELKQVRSPRYWTPDGRLFLASTWVKDGENTAKATWTYWLYDPKANRFEKTDSLPRSGFPYTRMAWGKIMRHDGSWFAVGPEPKFQRPAVRSGKPGGPLIGGSGGGGGTTHATNGTNVTAVAPPPGAGAMGDVKVENVSETIEFLDVAGKVLRKVALDIQALAGTSLFVHTASADGRYLLVSTFTTLQFLSGMPFPKLEKTLLIDLQTGNPLPAFQIDAVQYGMRTAFTAVMSASREVLVVNQPKGNPASFLFLFPFDGGAPVDCGTALALPVSGMNWQNTAAFGDIDQMNSRRMDADRIVMGVQPRNWANVQDPKYRNEPRRLLVFWNSTQPIAAFASRGLADEPTNITWSPAGDRFAFTAGATLHVWQPMRE